MRLPPKAKEGSADPAGPNHWHRRKLYARLRERMGLAGAEGEKHFENRLVAVVKAIAWEPSA